MEESKALFGVSSRSDESSAGKKRGTDDDDADLTGQHRGKIHKGDTDVIADIVTTKGEASNNLTDTTYGDDSTGNSVTSILPANTRLCGGGSNERLASSGDNQPDTTFQQLLYQATALHEEKTKQLQQQVDSCHKQIQDLQAQLQVQAAGYQTVQSEAMAKVQDPLEAATEKCTKLEEALNAKDHTLIEMEKALEVKGQECDTLRTQALEAIDELKKYTITNNSSITRDDIVKQWNLLSNEIHNLSRLKFSGHPHSMPTRADDLKKFEKMSSDYKWELKRGKLKKLLFEGTIWYQVVENILQNPGCVFHKPMGMAMAGVRRKLIGTPYITMFDNETSRSQGADLTCAPTAVLKQCQSWLAHTCQLLKTTYPENGSFEENDMASSIHGKFLTDMVNFLSKYSSTSDDPDGLRVHLRSIIHHALNLGSMLARSQDLYMVCMPVEHFFKKMAEGVTLDTLNINDLDVEELMSQNPKDTRKKLWDIDTRFYGFSLDKEFMAITLHLKESPEAEVDLLVSPMLLRTLLAESKYIMDIREMAANNPTPPPGFDAENAQNLEDMEKQFAVKVVQHMEIYWSILEKVKGSTIRLTKLDDEIYEHLQTAFPEFDPAKAVDEDEMKSPEGKKRWREFMMKYEKTVDDYNFGTMVRANPKTEYTQEGTIFVPRMQFYAIEIARNRNGINDWIWEEKQKEKTEKS
ncbi:hypothetical protein SCAR479_13138 [Seiridium cardinale]|uniref:Polysaccharide biosynthesis domain-containing protein n=1 Tax=Seiridium cardinale TaxID=138064 RepID=A0ABR2X8S9_9PEZI